MPNTRNKRLLSHDIIKISTFLRKLFHRFISYIHSLRFSIQLISELIPLHNLMSTTVCSLYEYHVRQRDNSADFKMADS